MKGAVQYRAVNKKKVHTMSAAIALVERAVQRKFFKAPTVAQKNSTTL
jgi:hypothetical protein